MAACLLHASALMTLMLWPARSVQSPPGEQEITIDLAPAMALAEAVPPEEETSAEQTAPEPQNVQPLEPLERDVPSSETVETPAPVEPPKPEAVEDIPAETPPAPEPQVVEALPLPEKPIEKPVPEPVKQAEPRQTEPRAAPKTPLKIPPKTPPKTSPAPRQPATPRKSTAATARQAQAPSSREDTGGAAASADPNVMNRYAAQLAAALRSRLRYPESARIQGLSGVATIRFTMQRSGRIVSAALVRSTGSPILDQAALATAEPGTSLPQAPAAIPQQQFTFTVPLRFNLR